VALQKEKTLATGVTGNYWRIVPYNCHTDRNEDVITLQLHLSQEAREAEAVPLNDSARFIFVEGDHPLSDFDPSRVDTADVEDFRDLELHIRYLHILDVAAHAQNLVDEFSPTDEAPALELTANERAALFFSDAVSV